MTTPANCIIIGPLPPPLGGISVYVSRLSHKMRTEGNSVTNMDFTSTAILRKIWYLARIVLDPRPMRIDLHAFDFSAMAATLLRPFTKAVTYMDHNTLLYTRELTGMRAMILKRFMGRADEVSFVSEEGLNHYRSAGFRFRNAVVRNAYLPPPMDEEARIVALYSPETRNFLAGSKPLLVANASQVVFLAGQDLYGLDLCVELVIALREEFPSIGLLFALANSNENAEYLAGMKARLREAGAERNFFFLTGQQELWPIFRMADLMLRPTTGDGFAVSIAEALALGCPVVASDAVQRPNEVTLFRSRDINDLIRQTKLALAAGRQSEL